jgi:Questin oxidase-like
VATLNSLRLRALLTDAVGFDAEYGASLSNHLPMALAALARLGASDERLAEFAERYARRLHAAPPTVPWPAGDAWRACLGEPAAWPRYRALFRDWIANEGAPEMLAQALPVLMQGAGAAAFHGPIRAAYALAANHADELADALAYWACRWFSCGNADGRGAVDDPARVFAAFDLARELPPQPLISQRMAAAAAHPRFAPIADALHIDARRTLPRLAQLAAERYAAGADFTVLHLVTSAHAMQVLLPWLDENDRLPALAHYARACAAAWAALPPREPPLPAAPVLPWDEIVARVIESDDEHAIKLVDSGRELEAALGGAVWHLAASRASSH